MVDVPFAKFFDLGGSLKVSWYGDCLPTRDFPLLATWYAQGRLDLDGVVTRVISLEESEEAFHAWSAARRCAASSSSRESQPGLKCPARLTSLFRRPRLPDRLCLIIDGEILLDTKQIATATVERKGETGDRKKLESLRSQLPAVTATRYFNAGSNGPIPLPAHQSLVDQATADLNVGRCDLAFYGKRQDESRQLRETIAGIFNANVSEVAIMRSTTEGMNAALNGVLWRPSDEIITTQLEHICLYSAIGSVSHRFGVTVRTVDIGDGSGDVLGAISKSITPRTRVIAISHVQWTTGAIMPLWEIAEFARERGILTIIDGAQGAARWPSTFMRSVSTSIARPARSGFVARTAPDSCSCATTASAISARATCDTEHSTRPDT